MRVAPDDEVYRVNTVWLGPRGLTFPWTARYLAYAVWLVTFLVVITFEGLTPLSVGVPPTWEVVITTLLLHRRARHPTGGATDSCGAAGRLRSLPRPHAREAGRDR